MTFNYLDCPLPPQSSVWVYLRDSGGDSQDMASQRAFLLGYCEHYLLRIDHLFEDQAKSGGSTAGRDQFELMIRMAEAAGGPHVDAILLWDTRRFARNILDSRYFKALLRRLKYQIVYVSKPLPEDHRYAAVIEVIDEAEAEGYLQRLAEETKRGLDFLISLKDPDGKYLGVFPNIRPPTFFRIKKVDIGLRRNNGRARILRCLEPDPDRWERGKRAMALRADGASYRDIEKTLGLFPQKVNPNSTYTAIFKNEIYIGRFHWGEQVCEDYVPALATMEQWEQIQARRYLQPKRRQAWPEGVTHPRERGSVYLLSGLCNCVYCQSRMNGNSNTRPDRQKSWRYYACERRRRRGAEVCASKPISAARLEQAVSELVISRVLTVDWAQALAEQVNLLLSDTAVLEQQLADLAGREQKLNRAIDNLLRLAEADPVGSLLERLRSREDERAAIRRDLERLRGRTVRAAVRLDEAIIGQVLADWRDTLREGQLEARRLILRQVVDHIDVGRAEGVLHYRISLDGFGFYYMPPTGLELKPNNYACEFVF